MSRVGEVADRSAERGSFGWTALAAALAVGASSAAIAQPLAQPGAPAAQTDVVALEADELINDEAAQTVTAQGDVQVRYRGRTMRADRLVYNLASGEIHAIGNVEIVAEDGSATYAEEINADEAMNVGAATELRARLGQNSTLAARAALRHGPGESELRNVIYTSCPICETGDRPPTWSLRARRAIQDNESRTISYQSAVLEIAGLPVLYLPYFAHPDPSLERATGFLAPDFGRNDRLGDFYEQPYHWAISPSQDLTISARVHGNVKPLLGLEYRKRFWSGEFNIDTTLTEERLFNSDGELFGESQLRSSVFARGLFRVNEDWDWGFGVERVYDDQYLRRYEIDGAGERRGPYIGQDTRLISQLYGIGQDKNFYSSLSFVGFQDLRIVAPVDLTPTPVILPFAETEHVLRDPLLGGQIRLQTNTALLARDDNPATLGFEGNDGRLSAGATWRRDLVLWPGLLFSPFAQLRGDLFQVETAPGKYESFGRGLGLGGAEISWPFMRPGERFDVIVEPVAMIAYASNNADDPRIINEDSLGFELDDSNLFRPNAAPNYDLWEPGQRISAGVRATARGHGGESASLMLGRRWRDEPAPGFGPQTNLSDNASDWVVAAQADAGRNFGAEARLRVNDETLDVERIDLGVRASIDRFSGSARYFSINDTLSPGDPSEEISGNLGVELARGWRAQFGITRDLDSDINLRQDIRAIYEDDCTFLEIAYTRSETQTGAIGPGEGIHIRIGLRSLGVFGGS